MKAARVMLVIVSAVLVASGFHLCSSNRDLEVALGVRKLPSSMREKKVRSSAFTDYSVFAFFRVDPADFASILAARPYKRREFPDGPRNPMKKVFPGLPPFDASDVYEWSTADLQAHCTLWSDAKRSEVFLLYSAD
jgi:hypothetical protein